MSEPERNDAPLDEEGNETNSQLLELQDALINAMTASGLLGKIRAELRGAALGMLRGDDALQKASVGEPFNLMRTAPATRLSVLIVQDFLRSKGLEHSSGVLEAEASTSLHSEGDVAVLESKFASLPGEGSVLERLVSMVLDMNSPPGSVPVHSSQQREQDTTARRESVSAANEPSRSDRSDVAPAFTVDGAIRDGLDRYEASLVFDEVNDPLDPQAYDNVETL